MGKEYGVAFPCPSLEHLYPKPAPAQEPPRCRGEEGEDDLLVPMYPRAAGCSKVPHPLERVGRRVLFLDLCKILLLGISLSPAT